MGERVSVRAQIDVGGVFIVSISSGSSSSSGSNKHQHYHAPRRPFSYDPNTCALPILRERSCCVTLSFTSDLHHTTTIVTHAPAICHAHRTITPAHLVVLFFRKSGTGLMAG